VRTVRRTLSSLCRPAQFWSGGAPGRPGASLRSIPSWTFRPHAAFELLLRASQDQPRYADQLLFV
jgi:hypothetical protein